MTEPAVEPELNTTDSNAGGHPAWQEIYDALPTSLHGQVTPLLQKFDSENNKRYESLQSTYEPFKPYVEQGLTAEQIDMGVQLLNTLQTDPEGFYSKLSEVYGNAGQGTPEADTNDDEGSYDSSIDESPAIKRMQQQIEAQQAVISQREQREQDAENERQFVTYMGALEAKHGNFDKDYVTALIAHGVNGEEAVARYKALIPTAANTAQAKPPAPVVLGGAGAAPTTQVKPVSEMTAAERKAFVIEKIKAAHEAAG